MLLLGKTFYRNNNNGGGGGAVQTPRQIDLGYIALPVDEDFPSEDTLAEALNNHLQDVVITDSDLVIFELEYGPVLDE